MDTKNYFACIDLGSNMCRMIVALPNSSFPLGFYIKKSFSMLISIGENPNVIDAKSIARALKALIRCKEIIDSYSRISYICIGTAIFRSASNSLEAIRVLREKSGIRIKICDPSEEITLSSYGCEDVFVSRYAFLIDMGGGSTEIGLCEKSRGILRTIDWISLPYGLFYFAEDVVKPIPTDAHKIILRFASQNYPRIPIIISRSGIMKMISNYICKKISISQDLIHGKVFEIGYVIKAIDQIIRMSDLDLLKNGIVANALHIKSSRASIIFTKMILKTLPIDLVILSHGGVKEGMMNAICKGDINVESYF